MDLDLFHHSETEEVLDTNEKYTYERLVMIPISHIKFYFFYKIGGNKK